MEGANTPTHPLNHHHHHHVEFADHPKPTNDESSPDSATVPLLLRPSYARSKSCINDELRNFRISLKWCALDHSTPTGKAVSYLAFVLLSLVVPLFASLSIRSSSDSEESILFNRVVQIPETALAAIAFLTLSCFFRCYGLRQLLFLDGLGEDSPYVRRGYARELEKYLTYILLPSFLVELAHKVMFFSNVSVAVPYALGVRSFPSNSIAFVAALASWVYRTGVFLLVCVLFRLTCELQILRFEGFKKLFDGCETDAGVIFKEHVRIKMQLWATSHRYRFFIVSCMVVITISQLGALVLILSSKFKNTFSNSGDIVVCSAVQLSGFFMCLLGAARITHRAQGSVAMAAKWHMLMTCTTASTSFYEKDPITAAPMMDGPLMSDGPSDLDSSDQSGEVSSQETCAFRTRQALGESLLYSI
ncbi:hypothetical protein QJS10_CPA05g02468 [Acorus calamus]|uniref:Uncharacterized protein n=1 Tax=Acorus calamus TaxID=4465 RepID=A0AAV9EPM1_ACOCL|nr:hypothetical protein QJS10_CPA05g02468 [Acorus calamus]